MKRATKNLNMKITLIVLISILIVSYWIIGQSDWHLNRNKHNKLPEGRLEHCGKKMYLDEAKLTWELKPAKDNVFHQPDQKIKMVNNPYPNVDGWLEVDCQNPNLKFLSVIKNGESYEAILQPNGEYLTEGLKQGTYNYSSPGRFFDDIKHVFFDVIPHFINSKYKS
jgi:hypothetical protein